MHAAVSPSCAEVAAAVGPFAVLAAAGSASTFGCHTNGIAIASSATAVTATAIIRAFDAPVAPPLELVEPMESVEPCVSPMFVLCPMSAIDVTGCHSGKCGDFGPNLPQARSHSSPAADETSRIGSCSALVSRLRPLSEDL